MCVVTWKIYFYDAMISDLIYRNLFDVTVFIITYEEPRMEPVDL